MTPEQTAAAAIARSLRPWGLPTITGDSIGRAAVEAISAAELVIVPAGRMAELLELERAALGPLAELDGRENREVPHG